MALDSQEDIELSLKTIITDLFMVSRDSLDFERSFLELGLNSVLSVEFIEAVNKKFGIDLGVEVVFDYRGVKELTEYMIDKYGKIGGQDVPSGKKAEEATKAESEVRFSSEKKRDSDIAIIGISGRFAGSETVEAFWKHLQNGDCCVTEIDRNDWDEASYYDRNATRKNKSISKWGGLLDNIDKFDTEFFNITPREAERMDPQQRLFMEESFKAIEDSGYSIEQMAGKKAGVFVGGRSSDYKDKTLLENDINALTFLGTDMSILASRISYFLDLKGPSLAIDTACSSSLVAIHYACDSIRRGESEMALAGGVFIINSPEFLIMASKTEMLSPDGKCKTFDNEANGIVVGEGVGVLILKQLDAALEDGDHIYGIIKGSAINQDGRTQSITAPSSLSQKALIVEAYKKSRINPETISYIEAHGTGTKLGDPIEMRALTEAFQSFTDKTQFCAIGSHKPNFGHSIMAAGIAGVFKILMAMKYRKIPPTIHFTKVNEHVDFESSPFFLNTELLEWKQTEGVPLRAGVSSFGFSGTNCHLIIEEPPVQEKMDNSNKKPYYPFTFSAKTKSALRQKLLDISKWLETGAEHYLFEDIAYTLLVGRSNFPFRCAFIAKDVGELKQKVLEIIENGTTADYFSNDTNSSLKREPVLKELNEYCERLSGELGLFSNITSEAYKEKLSALLYLFTQGYCPNWIDLFVNNTNNKVPLPTYPFNGNSFWIPKQKDSQISSEMNSGISLPSATDRILSLPGSQVELQPVSYQSKSVQEVSGPQKPELPQAPEDKDIHIEKPKGIALKTMGDGLIPSSEASEQRCQEPVSVKLIEETLISSLANMLGIKSNTFDIDTKFVDMGLDSIIGVEWIQELNNQFELSIRTTKIYDYPTIREFTGFLDKELKEQNRELLSLQLLIQQVHQGKLGAEQANQIFNYAEKR
ncbi:hypothetical protein KIH86_26320 [Paenibacillus sp. HN-1]|uniref:beta-ketoacyl synthase N-terminal-like domain-containing protein n=1 Tax=Paenibacillus TaxID=44249 RepID=UPI001CA9CBCC|nr:MULTISPECIES: beta-ketoacyl synthase N-terminal-like domain-containing protein [Paenibacillus]MBY9078357.1 hypothetical protein [Paenibacillus sp. CGMCC 1.18879]MBY9087708.1 hypothetical protein [Paenibacillus sinensis]